VRLYAGRPFALDAHLARMERSARGLRLPLDAAALRADVDALLRVAGEVEAALRLVVTRGGRRIVLVQPLAEQPTSVALATVEYVPTRVLDQIKSLSYAANMLAMRLAAERGAGDALLVTPHGRVLEAPTASFFCVLDGEVCTPPLSERVLDSITRRHVEARERVITLDDLDRASECFIASTLREVLPVHAVDHRRYEAPGPRTRAAVDAFAALVRAPAG